MKAGIDVQREIAEYGLSEVALSLHGRSDEIVSDMPTVHRMRRVLATCTGLDARFVMGIVNHVAMGRDGDYAQSVCSYICRDGRRCSREAFGHPTESTLHPLCDWHRHATPNLMMAELDRMLTARGALGALEVARTLGDYIASFQGNQQQLIQEACDAIGGQAIEAQVEAIKEMFQG